MNTDTHSCAQTGFSLVEILVAMIIGLLGIMVMFQVMSLWESLKRTTAAGSDAQIAGTAALSILERDVRPAGMGFGRGVDGAPVPSLGCTVSAKGSTASFVLAPVIIVEGASGAPDQIITLHGNSDLFVSTQKFKASTSSSKTVDGSFAGFRVGDVVVAGGDSAGVACELFEVSSVATPGELGHATALRFNPAPSQTALSSGFLYNLGPLPQRGVWTIARTSSQPGLLRRQDSLESGAPTRDVADNIIDLQAQYGIDGFGGGNATDGRLEDGDWTTTTPANWSRVLAIRVGLLARSQQLEKTEVTDGGPGTAPAPAWTGGGFDMTNTLPGASGDAANWKRYRYRVYEKVIPLRNMVWGGEFN